MAKNIAFSDHQVEQLTELLFSQHEATVNELKTYVDQRFLEEREITKQLMDQRFLEERSYYQQLIREELADIRFALEKLDRRTDNAEKDALTEIDELKKRLVRAEREIAKLKLALA
ncbi:hypothetical protein HYW32_01425 [Candidatus Berkelbacteria bacterium]|nr:hypothetical protein [Candidatus Berkelbacteria bacterium]